MHRMLVTGAIDKGYKSTHAPSQRSAAAQGRDLTKPCIPHVSGLEIDVYQTRWWVVSPPYHVLRSANPSLLQAKVSVEGWEEVPLELPEDLAAGAPKLVRIKFNRIFKGDLEGKGMHQCLSSTTHLLTSLPFCTSRTWNLMQFPSTASTGVEYYNGNYHNDGGGDPQKSTARYAGLTYFSGEVKGVGKGTIVFIGDGTWDPAVGAICEWVSDPSSGTGDLAGLKAKAHHVGTPASKEDPVTLEIQK